MSRSTLRVAIIVLTAITATVHLVVLNIGIYRQTGSLDIPFTLNGLGYIGLLGALLLNIPFLADYRELVHYAYIAFAAVTILAWYFINGDFTNPLGVGTKIVEVLLIVALVMHLQKEPT